MDVTISCGVSDPRMSRPRSYACALGALSLIMAASGVDASCLTGPLSASSVPIVSFAVSPSGRDFYLLLRETSLSEASRYAIEHRDGVTGASRRVYVTSGTVLQLAADASAVYFAERTGPDGDTRIVRLERQGTRSMVLASFDNPSASHIHVHGEYVYVVATASVRDATGRIQHPAQIVRISTNGGDSELVVAWSASISRVIDSAERNLYYVLQDFDGVSSIFKYDTQSRHVTHLYTTSDLQSFAVDGSWLYVATRAEILRISTLDPGAVETISAVQPFVHDSGSGFSAIDVMSDRIVARQSKAAGRGCVSDILVQYTTGGAARLLSSRAGPFQVTADGVFHVPKSCFLIAPQPPFVLEQFCLSIGKGRAVQH